MCVYVCVVCVCRVTGIINRGGGQANRQTERQTDKRQASRQAGREKEVDTVKKARR
jgi:DhnA family fructose-bisphosphate aldolase class Ia